MRNLKFKNDLPEGPDYSMSTYFIKAGDKHGFNPELLVILAHVRSYCNPWYFEFSQSYRDAFLANTKARARLQGHVPDEKIVDMQTEKNLRATKLGLYAILGQKARIWGYEQDNLAHLLSCEESINFVASLLGARIAQGMDTFTACCLFNTDKDYYLKRKIKEYLETNISRFYLKY